MANLPQVENPTFPDVYILAEDDPIVGGLDGVDNLPHRQLAERTEFLRRQTTALQAVAVEHEGRLQGVEASGSVAVGRAFPLFLELSDEGAEFELFSTAPYSWRDYAPTAVLGTIAGDESVDVASTNGLVAGASYVIRDPDGSTEVVVVEAVLTNQRFRAVSALTRTRTNSGTMARTSWEILPGYARAGAGTYFSRQLRVLRYDTDGRLLVRRNAGDGSLAVQVRRVSEPATDWQACPLRNSLAVGPDLVDQEYRLPLGGIVEIRIDSMPGEDGQPLRIDHLIALTSVRAERADFVRRPTNVSPAAGAVGVMETPTLTGDAFYSLYGLAQAAAEFQIATDAEFANVIYTDAEAGAVVQHVVAGGTLAVDSVYWWRTRYQDAEGTWSPWSAPTGFSTGAVFQYVAPPAISAPAAGATTVSLTPTITTAAFAPVGAADTHAASRYQIATDAAFAAIVYDSGESADLTAHAVPLGSALARQTAYFLRARHKGTALGWSDWSQVRSFTTTNSADAPVITSPADGAVGVSPAPTITTSAFSLPGGGDAHVATQYQIATDAAFATIVYDSGESVDLTSHAVPAAAGLDPLTTYHARARHKGASSGFSPWSVVVDFTTLAPAGDVTFTSSGIWPVPAGVTSARILIVGGGLQGGPGSDGGNGAGSAGGNSGPVKVAELPLTPGDEVAITIGGSGQTSSLGTLLSSVGGTVALGGAAGPRDGTNGDHTGSPGAAHASVIDGHDITAFFTRKAVRPGVGGLGVTNTSYGGYCGGGGGGAGGIVVDNSTVRGQDFYANTGGEGYGAGGAGQTCSGSGTARRQGAQGIIYIEWG